MKYFDNDMDELFNKAGQDYPLNTNKKDWDTVLKTLQSDQSPVTKKGIFNRYLRFLPILLLLLVPVVFLVTQQTDKQSIKSSNNTNTTLKDPSNFNEKQPQSNDVRTQKKDLKSQTAATRGKEVRTSEAIEAEATNTQNKNETDATTQRESELPAALRLGQKIKTTTLINLSSKDNENRVQDRAARIAPGFTPEKQFSNLTSGGQADELLPFTKHPLTNLAAGDFDPSLLFHPLKEISPSGMEQQKNNTKAKKQTPDRITNFYYGIKTGPDFTSIKGQRIETAGWAAGMIVGYQFHRRWSLEMSALWSKKQYYTDGKYFDKTRANIPPNVNIYYLDGGCNMIEVPVSVRYLFSSKQNAFFATAGLNSYFMKKEDYAYEANAGTGVYGGHRSYKNSGNYFAATLQLTGGYQFRVFNKTNIRIEPYLQLPLQDVGIGRMPITSTGVHFGLIRNIR